MLCAVLLCVAVCRCVVCACLCVSLCHVSGVEQCVQVKRINGGLGNVLFSTFSRTENGKCPRVSLVNLVGQRAASFDSSRKNSPGPDTARIDRSLVLDSTGGGACPFSVGGVIRLVTSFHERDSSLVNNVKCDPYLISSRRDRSRTHP